MQFYRALEDIRLSDSWLTIGSFDGVHRGHQSILSELTAGAHAAGSPAVAVIFNPHPIKVLRPDSSLSLLSSIEERAALFSDLGLDALIAHPFTLEVARLPAEEFVRRLKKHLGFSRFFVGHDFAMGRDRDGDIPKLQALGAAYAYELKVFEPVGEGESIVSSSRIRSAIAEGRADSAARLLGRPYSLPGRVVAGSQRGRSIGIPTANIAVAQDRAVPKTGVYACRITVAGETYGAATNIGVRPTFEPDTATRTVETHILDFNRDIYGQVVRIAFLKRLRGERIFPGADALVAQIRADILQTREVLCETVS